jgi:formate--tetrahydrofolate ligase
MTSSPIPSDLDVARAARLKPMEEIAARLGVPADALIPYGRHVAKLDQRFVEALAARPQGRLILVTAISPTPAGEGKTTTTVGLGDALTRLGHKAAICLREPSLGPCFGMKGGAAGGGYAQIAPMEQINLHFTGDFHAISAAHNLLAAMVDNHVYWGLEPKIDPRRVSWGRVVDMNDRALRQMVIGLGGPANGFSRESGFEITVASEVMAAFCLASSLDDLEARLARIIVGRGPDKRAVTAADVKAAGAMAVLLKDAFQPNLVQSLEGTPALVHGGPFANIAHGCNSLAATRAALALADWTVTEAGFGADLGAEKFLDVKCRQAGLAPSACVVVATVRALKMHGGLPKDGLAAENVAALRAGFANLDRHVRNLQKFGLPVVVAVNAFASDTPAEHEALIAHCRDALGVEAHLCRHFSQGGEGATDLARAVVSAAEAAGAPTLRLLYPDDMPLFDKIETVAREIYGAARVEPTPAALAQLKSFEEAGFGALPVCIAKTQYSFSTDPNLRGAPSGHVVPLREARLSAGAGFVVALAGEIMTMPGLPKAPAAHSIRLKDGEVVGLF